MGQCFFFGLSCFHWLGTIGWQSWVLFQFTDVHPEELQTDGGQSLSQATTLIG